MIDLLKTSRYKIVLIIITLLGLTYRLIGISTNHSFWADEAFISGLARSLLTSDRSLSQLLPLIHYQPLHFMLTVLSLSLFGLSEWSARFPTVLTGTIGIVFAYLLATKLSNRHGGVIAAFVHAFSQLNLANSTQAKPYITIQTLTLVFFYLLAECQEKKEHKKIRHILIVVTLITASLMHYIGALLWLAYVVFLIGDQRNEIKNILYNPRLAIGTIFIIMLIVTLIRLDLMIQEFLLPYQNKYFIVNNNTLYLIQLFAKKYFFYVLAAVGGLSLIFKHYRTIMLSIVSWGFVLLFLWNFRVTTHNLRYLIPLFGLIFVLFGVFWGKVGEHYFKKRDTVFTVFIIAILCISSYKISLFPSHYYSPNVDFYGDVQNADYKTTYKILEEKFPSYQDYFIVNDVIDTQLWYLNGRLPDATVVKAYTHHRPDGSPLVIHPITKKPIYTSLEQFIQLTKKNSKGLLIVEDWESILNEDVKQYAKKNLKKEIRVEGITSAEIDRWPLEVYSWNF